MRGTRSGAIADPQTMHRPFGLLMRAFQVAPVALHPAVSAYRCASGLPRIAHPSAGPANDSSGLPDVLVAWPCRRWISGLPRISHASAVRWFVDQGCPFPPTSLRLRYVSRVAPFRVSPALPAMDRRVAPIHTSFGGAGGENFRLPRRFALPVSPTIRFQVAPVPVSSGPG